MRRIREATFGWNPTAGIWPPDGSTLRDVGRAAVVVVFLVLLGYCLTTAWTVLGELGTVKLADCRRTLDVVSVRDALLSLVGYKVGIELLRAATRGRNG